MCIWRIPRRWATCCRSQLPDLEQTRQSLGWSESMRLHHHAAGVYHPWGVCMNDHAVRAGGGTRWGRGCAAFDFHHADAAAARTVHDSHTSRVSCSRAPGYLYSRLPSRLVDGCAASYAYLFIVYGYIERSHGYCTFMAENLHLSTQAPQRYTFLYVYLVGHLALTF